MDVRRTGHNPAAFVVSLNLKRRHLNESQRAMVASGLANMRQGARTDIASIDAMSQDAAAALLNVSRPSLQRAKQVTETGAPELVQAVQAGEVSVSAAADVATLPARFAWLIWFRPLADTTNEAYRHLMRPLNRNAGPLSKN